MRLDYFIDGKVSMNIYFKDINRGNWEEAIQLRVNKLQELYVPSVPVSLAKIYIKPDGDGVEYIPFSIYYETQLVGFIMFAFEADTTDMYWINGFLIDEKYQGKGYGKEALIKMINWIKTEYPLSEEIRLTVHKENEFARLLYRKVGFEDSGEVYGNENVMVLAIKSEEI